MKKAVKKTKGRKGKQDRPDIPPLERLRRDLRAAAEKLSDAEVRYLVDLYYQMQSVRIGTGNQISSMSKHDEPVAVIGWANDNMRTIEDEIKTALDIYTDNDPTGMGSWAKAHHGIGPCIAAGLLAHIDISKVKTVGGIWRFAGLDPTSKWEPHTKRPWNAALKTLCFKLGESFVKFQDKSGYGKLFVKRKAEEWARNLKGEFSEQAKARSAQVGKGTQAYKWYAGKLSPGIVRNLLDQGLTEKLYMIGATNVGDEAPMLPPAHIHARARRWTVKIFLYFWFAEAYYRQWHREPPLPYVIDQLKHTDLIWPENMSFVPEGFTVTWKGPM